VRRLRRVDITEEVKITYKIQTYISVAKT